MSTRPIYCWESRVLLSVVALMALACGGGGGGSTSGSSTSNPNVVTKPIYVRVGMSSANLLSGGTVSVAGTSTLAKPSGVTSLVPFRQKTYPAAVELLQSNGQTLFLSRIKDNLYQGGHNMATGETYLLKAQVGSTTQKGYFTISADHDLSNAMVLNSTSSSRAKSVEGHFRSKAVEGEVAVLAGLNEDPALLALAADGVLATIDEGEIKVLMRGQGDFNFSVNATPKIALTPATAYLSTQRYWVENAMTFTGFGTLQLTFPKVTGNLISLQVLQDGHSLQSGTYIGLSGEQVNTFFANESSSYEVQVDFSPPSSITDESGLLTLNDFRTAAGMAVLSANLMLEKSSFAHATYLVAVKPTNAVADSYHTESKLYPSTFTGNTASARAAFQGYSYDVTENVASADNVQDSIELLFGAIYHRFNFLDFSIAEVGMARANELPLDGSATLSQVDVFNMGTPTSIVVSGNGNPAIVIWPADGAVGVPPVFYESVPDPLPDLSVSGYPISVQFSDLDVSGNGVDASGNAVITISAATVMANVQLVLTSANTDIPVRALDMSTDPNSLFTVHQFAWFPLERLEYGTTYSANLSYDEAGLPQTKAWDFTTKSLEPILDMLKAERSKELISGKDYFLYFSPSRSEISTITSLSFVAVNGAEAQVESLDSNTVLVCLHGDLGSGITLTINGSEQWSLVLAETDELSSVAATGDNVIPE